MGCVRVAHTRNEQLWPLQCPIQQVLRIHEGRRQMGHIAMQQRRHCNRVFSARDMPGDCSTAIAAAAHSTTASTLASALATAIAAAIIAAIIAALATPTLFSASRLRKCIRGTKLVGCW